MWGALRGVTRRISAWLDEDWDDVPMPMTELDARRLLDEAAQPYLRAARRERPERGRFMRYSRHRRLWARHAEVARRLGYCLQPGCCQPVDDSVFCERHSAKYMSSERPGRPVRPRL